MWLRKSSDQVSWNCRLSAHWGIMLNTFGQKQKGSFIFVITTIIFSPLKLVTISLSICVCVKPDQWGCFPPSCAITVHNVQIPARWLQGLGRGACVSVTAGSSVLTAAVT